MPKTLAAAKPTLEKDLKKIFKEAAYEAFMTTINGGSNADAGIKNSMRSATENLSNKFAEKFSETLAHPLTEAIYNFTKEIGIQLTDPSTLISTSIMTASPVAGAIPSTGFNIT